MEMKSIFSKTLPPTITLFNYPYSRQRSQLDYTPKAMPQAEEEDRSSFFSKTIKVRTLIKSMFKHVYQNNSSLLTLTPKKMQN